MGSVHRSGKFIPNLSQLCFPLRPLLKKNTKFVWTNEHEEQLKLIKQKIAETTENKHFNPDLETLIKCDASRKGLSCALEQRFPNGCRIPITNYAMNSHREIQNILRLRKLIIKLPN